MEMTMTWLNHALQRTRPSRHCCNRGVSRAGSLNLGRSTNENIENKAQIVDDQEEVIHEHSADIWERIFRFAGLYLAVMTLAGGLTEAILGEEKTNELYPWLWVIVVPYSILFIYVLNYVVVRQVKNKGIKIAWFSLMGLVVTIVILAPLTI